MSSLNDCLKKITILQILIVLLALVGIVILFGFFGYSISEDWIYVGVIVYFIYRLRFFGEDFKQDLKNIFSKISLKSLIIIVLVNVFFSYGMMYLSIFAIDNIPGLQSFITMPIIPLIAANSLAGIGSIISTILISPICEELLFRGVFLNRLKLIVPTSFAIAITSILFGALHSYGSIISASIFGVCMCIIYLKTENILTCILAHCINNLLAEVMVHVDSGNLIFTNDIFIVLFSILAIVSLYLIVISISQEWKYINKR
ncbi:CPBP family intramembrane glutamic endopeptidase [Methanobrevibacter sp.]|uniref:CPBP family intramembrane glutamic endopeptidase n=1 Tax=Methanobrevibacter sp. TaxID=66852 RepID=UPI00388F721B